ncbi:MAG TPA: hypothetical protein VGN23_07505 [Verrucomicrobiae bacterium]|jgi:hypothetical protein
MNHISRAAVAVLIVGLSSCFTVIADPVINVRVSTVNIVGTVLTNEAVSLSPGWSGARIYGTNVFASRPVTQRTGGTGETIFSNVVFGPYGLDLSDTHLSIEAPTNLSGTVDASVLVTNPAVVLPNMNQYLPVAVSVLVGTNTAAPSVSLAGLLGIGFIPTNYDRAGAAQAATNGAQNWSVAFATNAGTAVIATNSPFGPLGSVSGLGTNQIFAGQVAILHENGTWTNFSGPFALSNALLTAASFDKVIIGIGTWQLGTNVWQLLPDEAIYGVSANNVNIISGAGGLFTVQPVFILGNSNDDLENFSMWDTNETINYYSACLTGQTTNSIFRNLYLRAGTDCFYHVGGGTNNFYGGSLTSDWDAANVSQVAGQLLVFWGTKFNIVTGNVSSSTDANCLKTGLEPVELHDCQLVCSNSAFIGRNGIQTTTNGSVVTIYDSQVFGQDEDIQNQLNGSVFVDAGTSYSKSAGPITALPGNGGGLFNLAQVLVATSGPMVTTNPVTGQLTPTYNGSALTNLNAGQLAGGPVPYGVLPLMTNTSVGCWLYAPQSSYLDVTKGGMIYIQTGEGDGQYGKTVFNVRDFKNQPGTNYMWAALLYATNNGTQLLNIGGWYTTNAATPGFTAWAVNNYPVTFTQSNYVWMYYTNFITSAPVTYNAYIYNNGPTNIWYDVEKTYLTNW